MSKDNQAIDWVKHSHLLKETKCQLVQLKKFCFNNLKKLYCFGLLAKEK
jgi:hypothetical protein